MKNKMFKIAGVKTDKEFYAKYPTEEAFMAKHGKMFKAQFGSIMSMFGGGSGGGEANMPNAGNIGSQSMAGFGGAGATMGGVGKSAMDAGGSGGGAGGFMSTMGGVQGIDNTVGQIADGYKALRASRRARKAAEQGNKVSDVVVDAAESIDVDDRRHRSEIIQDRYNNIMQPINGEELFPVHGVGTNVLAKSGANIKSNRRKIPIKGYAQSGDTFMPGDYIQPIDQVKEIAEHQYSSASMENPDGFNFGKYGGKNYFKAGPTVNGVRVIENTEQYPWNYTDMKKAMENLQKVNPGIKLKPEFKNYQQGGFAKFAGGAGGQQVSNMAGNFMGNDGGSQIGGAVGGTVGSIFGPVGKMVGATIGKVAGGLLDTNAEKTKKFNDKTKANMMRLSGMNFGENIHAQNASYMQNGGDVEGMDNITPLWGGGIQSLSENPYTDGGETMMFSGDSHKEGGIGVNYAGNNIEAESGEPAMKMAQHGTGEEGLVIFGDLPISKSTAAMLGDPDAKGKKFKTYVKNIGEQENKANRRKVRAEKVASNTDSIDKFDRLKLGTQEIIEKGADEKLKRYASLKENAAMAQNAINETAEEFGVDPVLLAKGGDKFDRWLKNKLPRNKKFFGEGETAYAQGGDFIPGPASGDRPGAAKVNFPPQSLNPEGFFNGENLKRFADFKAENSHWFDFTDFDPTNKEDVLRLQSTYNKLSSGNRVKEDGKFGRQTGSMVIGMEPRSLPVKSSNMDIVAPDLPLLPVNAEPLPPGVAGNRGDFDVMPYLNAITPYIGRGSDAEDLNANQLLGEMYALSHNKMEPVYAQGYRPRLDVPYDISYQDSLNRNTSTARAAMRSASNNPAMAAAISAQRYGADQPVLAQQFRDNQAMKDRVYSGNRAILNDAQLKNLGIYDQQFVRQSQAKSNTKEAAQLAINSISDKYQKNLLEQRTLKTYENMYNYRFGDDYRAHNVNDPVDFESMQKMAEFEALNRGNSSGSQNPPAGYEYIYNESGQPIDIRKQTRKTPSMATPGFNNRAKYGMSMTKALKKY